MFCPKCSSQIDEKMNYCRNCGSDLGSSLVKKSHFSLVFSNTNSKDPDELTAEGIGKVIMGDGFFMVAIFLSVTHSSISSFLWLFLLIPAFFFFGIGLADVLLARQIRRKQKKEEIKTESKPAELPPPSISFVDVIIKNTSRELIPVPSVTEKTTRDLL